MANPCIDNTCTQPEKECSFSLTKYRSIAIDIFMRDNRFYCSYFSEIVK